MPEQHPLEPILRRMQQPSWLILSVLDPTIPLPGTQIIDRVEALYAKAGYPTRTLDPSTAHYAIRRLIEDGLVRSAGKREVDVPGPRGTTRRAEREVYLITGLGRQVLTYKQQLDEAAARLASMSRGRRLVLESEG